MRSYNQEVAKVLASELQKAQKSIWVCVTWFNHRGLFETLLAKAQAGVQVILLLQEDLLNRQASFSHQSLETYGGKVYWFKGNNEKQLLHEKYCIIDEKIVVYGSFNWTYNAAHNNLESILIVGEQAHEQDLVNSFKERFGQIIQQYFAACSAEAIVSLLDWLQGELQMLQHWCSYLETYLQEIRQAYEHIQNYVQLQLGELLLRKLFLLQEIARLKAQQVPKKIYKQDYQEQKTNYEKFRQIYEQFQQSEVAEKIIEQVRQKTPEAMKALYRELAKRLHPDRYETHSIQHQKATELMAQLNEAYQQQNWKRLLEIKEMVESGLWAELQPAKTQSVEELEAQIAFWRKRQMQLQQELEQLQAQPFYEVFSEKISLEDFVKLYRTQLERDIRELEKQLQQLNEKLQQV